jgi:(5-formylfuran-3-yl)methyl phosphate synthase
MTRLLVSVRSAAEAEAALRGGARLIDVKEPANGPLGQAKNPVIEEVLQTVAGRAPVSAAMGDRTNPGSSSHRALSGLAYVKIGLAGLGREDWRAIILNRGRNLAHYYPDATLVAAAYADWQAADAPPIDDVCERARVNAGGVFLIDTFSKSADKNLLDWLSLRKLALLCKLCRAAGVQVALAGCLGPEQIRKLLFIRPDWIAVRGAACEGGRSGTVSEAKVRELVALINSPQREN